MHPQIPKAQIIFSVIVLIGLVGWFVVVRTKNVPAVVQPDTTVNIVVAWPSQEVKKEFITDSRR